MKPDLLAIGAFPDVTMAALAERYIVHSYARVPETLPAEIAANVRALATEANRGAPKALLDQLPKLEIIAGYGVGTDLTDRVTATARGIPVTNTPGVQSAEVADLAMAMMLASARQVVFADRFVRDGSWARAPISLGRSVGGKVMGVVGLGGIGRAVADRGKAFGMDVRWYGPRMKPDVPYRHVVDLVALAREADFLMVCCRGSAETRHLISAAVIDALGPRGTLVNVSRGSVVDERALIAALRDGRLGFAALDVFENEPNVDPDLLALPNVIVQPHHGSATLENRVATGQLVVDNLDAHFAGRPLLTPVV